MNCYTPFCRVGRPFAGPCPFTRLSVTVCFLTTELRAFMPEREPQAIPPTDFQRHLLCSCSIQSAKCQCTHVTNHGFSCIAAVKFGIHPLELISQVSCQVKFWNCVPHQQVPFNGKNRKATVVQRQVSIHFLNALDCFLEGCMGEASMI